MLLLLKNLAFTFLVPGTVAGWLPWLIVRDGSPSEGTLRFVGVALFAVGVAIYGWCVWDFARFGRGTPAPIDAPSKLVVRGLYRFSRNPMYVGVLTTVLGWAALFESPMVVLYAVVVGSAFQGFVMLYEEPHLAQEFGEEYVRYKARVPRWLLPGL